MRMSLIRRTQLAQGDDILDRAESGKGESKVKAGRLVPGGPHDAVAARPIGIMGIVIRHLEVQRSGDAHNGQGSTRVAGSGGMERYQVIAAHKIGGLSQLVDGIVANQLSSGRIGEGHSLPFSPEARHSFLRAYERSSQKAVIGITSGGEAKSIADLRFSTQL